MISCFLDRRFNQLSHGAEVSKIAQNVDQPIMIPSNDCYKLEKESCRLRNIFLVLTTFNTNLTFEHGHKRANVSCLFSIQHRWFSGRMLACHAGGPGSIPGRCKSFFTPNTQFSFSTPPAIVQGILPRVFLLKIKKKVLETRGIDPRTSHMLSERSTI